MKKLFTLILAFTLSVLGAAEPEVRIPRITPERAEELASAETFWEEEWADAAVIRNFSNVSRGLGNIPQSTSFYLFHDGENFWAAAVCAEDDYENARAFARSAEDDLTVDEAVQVVVGFDGKVIAQLNMGGYEGAFDTLGSCSHLYEMTVNLAGCASRRYDETPLPDPKFQYAVFVNDTDWAVIFRIPFASIGYDWSKTPAVFFNLFRFHRGERYGWYLPGFGGYTKLPMGKAELLDFDRNGEATRETAPAAAKKETAAAREEFVSTAGRLDMEYFPVTSEVAAEVPAGPAGEITLTVNGKSVSASRDPHWPVRLKIPAGFAPGTAIDAVLACDGKTLLSRKFTAKASGEWRHGVALEYLEERVPYPWSSPVFDDAGGVLTLKHGTVITSSGSRFET